jgi:hypothetical protein
MKQIFHLFLFTLVLSFSSVEAKTFSSQFSEFELPNGWDCALEGSEWVCQSENKDRKKEAIIILAAKYRGEQDSLDAYQAYLKATKTFALPGGKTQISEPKSVDVREINGQRWVDSLHLASEVPGFYTRYLATVKDSLGIAVTFSVAKDHYESYQEIFDKIIATLKVFDQKANTNWKPAGNKGEENLLGDTFIPDGGNQADIGMQKKQKADGNDDAQTTMIGLIALAVIVFLVIKARKKKKK